MNSRRAGVGWMLGAISAAVLLKFGLVLTARVPLNADEAVVGLMARHILQGERPIFFYGQAYMGSLDAWLIAGAFALFGQQIWVIRLVQGLLYLGTILTTAWLGKAIWGAWRVGIGAAWLMAVPSINVTLYTTASLGGYGEALLLGNLTLLTALHIGRRLKSHQTSGIEVFFLLWGFLAGLGIWAFGLALVFSLPGFFYLLIEIWRARLSASKTARLALFSLGGGLAGAFPMLIYAAQNGVSRLIGELSGGAIAGVEGGAWIERVGAHLVNLLLLGLTAATGLRPPWEVYWPALPLAPFVLIFWAAVLIFWMRGNPETSGDRLDYWLVGAVLFTLVMVFILTPFGVDPSGRYFIPFAAPMALFGAGWVVHLERKIGYKAWGLIVLVVVFNLWGTIECAQRFPPGITTQIDAVTWIDHRMDADLIAFLKAQGERRGYSNYWTAYPLAFQSDETLIYAPRLPYHQDFRFTTRDDRYLPYSIEVRQSSRAAYITTFHPALDDYLKNEFARLKITWKEATIGDYHVFYQLSRKVAPEEIGLGSDRR